MAMPFREWNLFYARTLYGEDPNDNLFNNCNIDWTTDHITGITIGDGDKFPWKRWTGLFIPSSASFASLTSLDQVVDALMEFTVLLEENTSAATTVYIQSRPINDPTSPNVWDESLCSGRFYDGLNNWNAAPPHQGVTTYVDQTQITIANLPQTLDHWIYSYKTGVGCVANANQAGMFRTGFIIRCSSYDASPNIAGKVCKLPVSLSKVKVRYFNAVVNDISETCMESAGGIALVLTGLGFNIPDAELNENAHNPPAAWNDDVDTIYFIGLQGQGTYTLTSGAGDFTVDSNIQITIGAMPAMAEGTYEIKLRKTTVCGGDIPIVDSYAGDFSCDDSGRISESTRFIFQVAERCPGVGERRQPVLMSKWAFKNKAGDTIFRHYAPIDIRAPSVFYDGRILNVSSLRRAVDDKTGLFSISDMTVDLANGDKEFSKLMASYFLKNQIVELYHHWCSEPHASMSSVMKCIIDDYALNGPVFKVMLKDITRKYFAKRLPLYICTETEFSNIHDSAKGRAMPEVLGLCSVTTGTAPGAVEAVYVDTTTFEYLAARGTLNSVLQVYSDGALKATPADYSVVYKDGGRTYLDFTADQGDNKITFNAQGYIYVDWNSANGYVQNPAYILAFFLAFLAEIPIELIDMESIDDVAALMVTEGWDESGHLVMQDQRNMDEWLQEMLFTMGAYGFNTMGGVFKLEKKSLEDFGTSLYIYDQIDLLAPADRAYNLRDAANYANAVYDFYPAPNQFFGSNEDTRPSSIEDFEAEIEPGTPYQFPWSNSPDLISQRLTDLLYKYGYGDNKIYFSVGIRWINDLDLLTNFRFQDPFGLSATGAGEAGRYYYITSLDYNWMGGSIAIEAVDLQWLLRQYFILGDEDLLSANWSTAGEADRMFGYLCDEVTGKFQDGEQGKILGSEDWL